MLCKSIGIQYLHGTVQYVLVGVIYLGGFHFSAHLCGSGKVWNYDGHVNNGIPLQEPDIHDFDLCTLPCFEDQEAHLFVYALNS
ncbi:hypothetical protein EDD16DRAFT_1473856 [Pisolithus croceorrhizus]|nr:hypothetical protein EDD16DRAFT_1473856 [Pisolithus croceorrhizus]